jgi:hypothetical protein
VKISRITDTSFREINSAFDLSPIFCFLTKREIIILVVYICNNDVNSQQTFSWKNKKKKQLGPLSDFSWLTFILLAESDVV